MSYKCYGMTQRGKRCTKTSFYNGYCHQHTSQDTTEEGTCLALNTKGVKCGIKKNGYFRECLLHEPHQVGVSLWMIFNSKKIVLFDQLDSAENYLERSGSKYSVSAHMSKNATISFPSEVIASVVDLIKEFTGEYEIFFTMTKYENFIHFSIVEEACTPWKTSKYRIKIGKVYNMDTIEKLKCAS